MMHGPIHIKNKSLPFKRLFYTSISTQNKEQAFLITKQRE